MRGGTVEDGDQDSGTRMDVHATARGGTGTMGRCGCAHSVGAVEGENARPVGSYLGR
jgi:hypothetical protein